MCATCIYCSNWSLNLSKVLKNIYATGFRGLFRPETLFELYLSPWDWSEKECIVFSRSHCQTVRKFKKKRQMTKTLLTQACSSNDSECNREMEIMDRQNSSNPVNWRFFPHFSHTYWHPELNGSPGRNLFVTNTWICFATTMVCYTHKRPRFIFQIFISLLGLAYFTPLGCSLSFIFFGSLMWPLTFLHPILKLLR